MPMTSQIRAFIAIPVSDAVRRQAQQVQRQFQDQGIALRWVRPGAIHVTLRFLGDIEPGRMSDIAAAMTEACSGIRAFDMHVQGLGVFPTIRKPRVLWMGITGEGGPLHELHRRVETSLAAIGFRPEKRRFTAHLTIGRTRGDVPSAVLGMAIERFGAYTPVAFFINEVVLFKSILAPSGARYERLAAVTLPESG